jgi:hypothetical protein
MSESTPVTTPAVAKRWPARRSRSREAQRFRAVAACLIFAGGAGLYFASPDVRAVMAPAFATASIALFYLSVQIRREGHLPIFEAATFFVVATAVYTIVPLLQFALGGMQCGILGDNRLYRWQPTPNEFGGFSWRHVVLLGAFVLVYLPVRGHRLWPIRTPVRPMRTTATVILVTVIGISLWFFVLNLYFGRGASVYQGEIADPSRTVPYVVLQLANVLQMVNLTLKQCLIILLLLGFRRRRYRYMLIVWMLAEAGNTLVMLESRTNTMLLLLTLVVGYHHLVRPLRVKLAFIVGGGILAAFLVFGIFRDISTTDLQVDPHANWGAATEFQILYGTAYDVYMRKAEATLPPVPRQIYFSDFYRLIPSQLLPFYKWDPSEWYLDVLGIRGTGQGYMFGVIAQSVIGFGYAELVVRAVLLALFYAFAHRIYRRYSRSFWVTIAYVFILSWAYYAFRSTSFDILYRLVYYFLPAWLLVKLLTIVVSKVKMSGRQAVYA